MSVFNIFLKDDLTHAIIRKANLEFNSHTFHPMTKEQL